MDKRDRKQYRIDTFVATFAGTAVAFVLLGGLGWITWLISSV